MKELYIIGDGLYISFDGHQFKLRAPRPDGDHVVYFDLSMFEYIAKYVSMAVQKND